MTMANLYFVEMLVKGRKSDLDELQAILQEEIDGGQSRNDYYTFYRSVKAMGFDPESVPDRRAFTDSLQRMEDDVLWVLYAGAWDVETGVMQSIHQRWPDLTFEWLGVDEFGQYAATNISELVGKYRISDENEGLSPFYKLYEWVGDEAVPVINTYYGTDCKTLQECFATTPQLEHSDQMLLREIELEVEPFKKL